jgi:hypothetical protein
MVVFLVVVGILLYGLIAVYVERKVAAFIQDRVGPIETGPWGSSPDACRCSEAHAEGSTCTSRPGEYPLRSSTFDCVIGCVRSHSLASAVAAAGSLAFRAVDSCGNHGAGNRRHLPGGLE